MNEEPEPFEQRLKRQPLRQVPLAWREEILAAASKHLPKDSRIEAVNPVGTRCRASEADRQVGPTTVRVNVRFHWMAALNRRWVSWLWPHPVAWGGLAAIWIFIFAVHFSVSDQAPVLAEKVSPPSPEVIAELRQQQRLFAELIGPNDSGDADRPKMFAPRPRSERVEFLTA